MNVRFSVRVDGICLKSFRDWYTAYALFVEVAESYGYTAFDSVSITNFGVIWYSYPDYDSPLCHVVELLVD